MNNNNLEMLKFWCVLRTSKGHGNKSWRDVSLLEMMIPKWALTPTRLTWNWLTYVEDLKRQHLGPFSSSSIKQTSVLMTALWKNDYICACFWESLFHSENTIVLFTSYYWAVSQMSFFHFVVPSGLCIGTLLQRSLQMLLCVLGMPSHQFPMAWERWWAFSPWPWR